MTKNGFVNEVLLLLWCNIIEFDLFEFDALILFDKGFIGFFECEIGIFLIKFFFKYSNSLVEFILFEGLIFDNLLLFKGDLKLSNKIFLFILIFFLFPEFWNLFFKIPFLFSAEWFFNILLYEKPLFDFLWITWFDNNLLKVSIFKSFTLLFFLKSWFLLWKLISKFFLKLYFFL